MVISKICCVETIDMNKYYVYMSVRTYTQMMILFVYLTVVVKKESVSNEVFNISSGKLP